MKYLGDADMRNADEGYIYPCPMCKAPCQSDIDNTDGSRSPHDICGICGWEDDGSHKSGWEDEISINNYSFNEARKLLQEGKKLRNEYPRERGLTQVTEAVADNDAIFISYFSSCYSGIRRGLYPAILEGTIRSKNKETVALCESICKENGWEPTL